MDSPKETAFTAAQKSEIQAMVAKAVAAAIKAATNRELPTFNGCPGKRVTGQGS
jgi:hypothetical protein